MRFQRFGLCLMLFVFTAVSCVCPACAATYLPGDTLVAVFTVTENPQEAVGIRAKLRYDHDALELIPSRDGANTASNDTIMMLDWNGIPEGETMLVLFRVLPDTREGTYPISAELIEANNFNTEDVVKSVRLSSPVNVAVFSASAASADAAASSASASPEDAFQWKETDQGFSVVKYVGSDTEVTISETVQGKPVTSIGNSAFSGCSNLTNITIPNSVTRIGDSAFSGCSSLMNVTIPNGVTSIGKYAFSWCSSLTSITIPNNVTSIGSAAFSGCSKLTVTTEKDSYAEQYCKNNNVKHTAIVADQDDAKYDFEYTITNGNVNIIKYIGKDTKAVIPKTIEGKRVTAIGESAFRNKNNLTRLTIPNGVTNIGSSAFYGCSSLTSVTIPGSVTSIGEYAFSGCNSLTGIVIPNSVTSIGENAFSMCYRLTSVTLSNGVTSIGKNAFSNCSSLTAVKLPNSVTRIGDWAFNGCTNLKSINIPAGVKEIGANAFLYCGKLTITVSKKNSYAVNYCKAHNIKYTAK